MQSQWDLGPEEQVKVTAGATYAVQAYLCYEIDPQGGSAGQWQLLVHFYSESGAEIGDPTLVASGGPGGSNDDWLRYGLDNLTTPPGAYFASVELRVERISGWVAFDDPSTSLRLPRTGSEQHCCCR